MLLVKDIVHVNAIISFAAVSLKVKFTELLFLVWHNVLVLKLALLPLQERYIAGCRQTGRVQSSQLFSTNLLH